MLILMPAPAVVSVSDVVQRIPLRHVTANQIILQLRFPNDANSAGNGPEIQGLNGLVGAGSTLVVDGTPEARNEVERLVKILDVPQRLLQVRVRVLKVEEVNGKRRHTVVSEGSVVTKPGRSFQIHTEDDASGWSFTGSATVQQDRKVRSAWTIEHQRLAVAFDGRDALNARRYQVTSLCVGEPGKPAVAAFFDTQGVVPTGVTGNTLEAVTRALPTNAFYVEVTASQAKATR